MSRRALAIGLTVLVVLPVLLTGCGSAGKRREGAADPAPRPAGVPPDAGALAPPRDPLPGMPPPLDPRDVYAADRPGMLSPAVRGARELVYVPNSTSNSVDVIDQRLRRVVARFATGRTPHHVTPSWDLRTLWVDSTDGNSLTPIDPRSGRPGRPVRVDDPYNLYFTPDGRFAIVVAERLRRLDFRDPRTMRLRHALPVPCWGVDHMDFSADGRYAVVSCEYSGDLLKLDVARQRIVQTVPLSPGAMPQDVKLSPDGGVFYVADKAKGGVWLVDGEPFKVTGFVGTGRDAHGLYASRDSRILFVSNRGEGTVSLLAFASRKVVRSWRLPPGSSPDMGGLSADGKVLWLSGRYSGEVYAIAAASGRLLARIRVGGGPHGLCVYPQPGRYSLGHTGVLR
jgi:DNA-binding beta-propeller fold protein YncE